MAPLLHTKRKAEDDLQAHLAQRSHRDCVDQPSVVGRIAEEGSLNFIIRNNDPRRLYVRPIAWTSEHLQLLDCKFVFENVILDREVKQASTIGGKDSSSSQPMRLGLSPYANHVKTNLLERTEPEIKTCLCQSILEAYNIHPQGSKYLPFRFNLRKIAQLPTEGVFASGAGPSSLAYISFETIQDIRYHHFRRVKGAAHPFTAKVRQRLWDIESPHLARDPYLVAILIALAQGQKRDQQRRGGDTDKTKHVALSETSRLSCQTLESKCQGIIQSFKVQVLAVYGATAQHFYVYTAIISAEFLDKFDKPWQCSSECPVVVEYHRIPVREELSLEMLHRILCPGSCEFCTGKDPLNRCRSREP